MEWESNAVIKQEAFPTQDEDHKSGMHHRATEGRVYIHNYNVILIVEEISLKAVEIEGGNRKYGPALL